MTRHRIFLAAAYAWSALCAAYAITLLSIVAPYIIARGF